MYGILRKDSMVVEKGVPSLDKMQKVVGGYITTALRVPSKTRKGITIDVFCNDEGLLMKLPINFARGTDGSPLAGDMILTASNGAGETVEANLSELKYALSYLIPIEGIEYRD